RSLWQIASTGHSDDTILSKRAHGQDERPSERANIQTTEVSPKKKSGPKRKMDNANEKTQRVREKARNWYHRISQKGLKEAKGKVSPETYERLRDAGEYRNARVRVYQKAQRKARKERLATGKANAADLRAVAKAREYADLRALKRRKKNIEQPEPLLTDSQQSALQMDLGRANRIALEQIPTTFQPHKQANKDMQKSSPDREQ
ncbi:uncharacterized protein FA14DRAFT_185137, partial [Meira miltonrushii]